MQYYEAGGWKEMSVHTVEKYWQCAQQLVTELSEQGKTSAANEYRLFPRGCIVGRINVIRTEKFTNFVPKTITKGRSLE